MEHQCIEFRLCRAEADVHGYGSSLGSCSSAIGLHPQTSDISNVFYSSRSAWHAFGTRVTGSCPRSQSKRHDILQSTVQSPTNRGCLAMSINGVTDEDLKRILSENLTPSDSIKTPERLFGREKTLTTIDRPFSSPATQISISSDRAL